MGKCTKLLRCGMLRPPIDIIFILLGFAMLAIVFIIPVCPEWLKYASYSLSAYALFALCVDIGRWWRCGRAWLDSHTLAHRFLYDQDFRNNLAQSYGICTNALYAALQGVLALMQHSGWLGALAGYYTLLTLMRLLVFSKYPHASNTQAAWKRYGAVGIMLIPLASSIQALLLCYLLKGKSFTYPGFAIYAFAAYSFTTLTLIIVRLIRNHGNALPLQQAALNIRFASALMSLLALQTALISTFGKHDNFQLVMNALTGGAICLTLLIMAIVMLIHAARQCHIFSKSS